MRNIKLLLAYDGTAYHGWERQKKFCSLQQTLEEAIQSLTGQSTCVVASGRTDAGVHAVGQVANFHSTTRHSCATIHRALNALLPDDFRVLAVEEVEESFHATYAAKGKTYRYAIHDGPVLHPFLRRYAVHCNWPMDDVAMRRACQCFLGRHDFSSFETAGAPRSSSVRTITHIAVLRAGAEFLFSLERIEGAESSGPDPPAISIGPHPTGQAEHLLYLEVAADGFLYNMVRAIAGTLINVGRGHWPAECVPGILAAQDRTQAGPTAPPHGLCLVQVRY